MTSSRSSVSERGPEAPAEVARREVEAHLREQLRILLPALMRHNLKVSSCTDRPSRPPATPPYEGNRKRLRLARQCVSVPGLQTHSACSRIGTGIGRTNGATSHIVDVLHPTRW